MKVLLFFLMAVLCYMSETMASPIPVRGVVEGFYGTPWTWEQRQDMVKFIGNLGMNAYIYAPKDDPYHREKWREPYPFSQRIELERLNEKAEKAGVQLIFAISPGLDIDFFGANKDNDRRAMINKMELMYSKGIRQFALFFDDIPEKNASGQAAFINYINNTFIRDHEDIKPLIVVPTEYFLSEMEKYGRPTRYTSIMSSTTSHSVVFLYTGAGCCPDGLSQDDVNKFKSYYRNNDTGIWWNYPVNDYIKDKLALGPIDNMPKNPQAEMFFVNPMERAELSKIAIATGADYAMDPLNYDETKSWFNALHEQYGKNDMDMMLFAEANQRLENDWAGIGRENTPGRKRLYEQLAKANKKEKKNVTKLLIEDTEARIEAYERLQKNLPEKVLKECADELKKGIEGYKADLKELKKK